MASGTTQGSSMPKNAAAQAPVSKKGNGTVSGTPRRPVIPPNMPLVVMGGVTLGVGVGLLLLPGIKKLKARSLLFYVIRRMPLHFLLTFCPTNCV